MNFLKSLSIFALLIINSASAQPRTKLLWGHMFYNSGNRNVGTSPFNPLPSNGRIDKNNRAYFIIPVYDTLILFNEVFTKSKRNNAVVCCFDSLGKLLWRVPINGGQNRIQVVDLTITSSGILVFGGNVKDSIKIGTNVLFDAGGSTFNYMVGIGSDGKLRFLKKGIVVRKLREAPFNRFLLSSGITGTEFFDGVQYDYGMHVTLLDSNCNIVEKIKLGSKLGQQILGICMNSDNLLFVSAKSEKNNVLHFLDSWYYPVDTTIGALKSDNHLFALEFKGGKRIVKWHLRIDSIVYGSSAPTQNLAADSKDHVYWSPIYNHRQTIFGHKLTMINNGGGYPFVMAINPQNGSKIKAFYSDTVSGLDQNDMALMNRADGKGVNAFFNGPALKDYNLIPDTLTNLESKVQFQFKDTFRFGKFYNTSGNYTNNIFYPFVAPAQLYMSPTKTVHNLDTDGHSFYNKGGYDVFVGYYGPGHWPNVLSKKNTSTIADVIYPNPGDGRLFVMSKQVVGPQQYYVTDLSGKIIQTGILVGYSLDLSKLSLGTYIIILYSANQKQVLKYLKTQ